jgi:hypothetical protein
MGECPHGLMVVAAGRGEVLECPRCSELSDAVEEAMAGDRTLKAVRCDDVQRWIADLGLRSSPSITQLAVVRQHVATCGACATHVVARRQTA